MILKLIIALVVMSLGIYFRTYFDKKYTMPAIAENKASRMGNFAHQYKTVRVIVDGLKPILRTFKIQIR